jgi:hypothetical protein
VHIEALRLLARTDQPDRTGLIEKNIEDYLKTEPGNERAALQRLRDAIDHAAAENRQSENWSSAKD